MHELHQPVKDGDVTVDRDVYVVERLLIGQVLLEVLHAGQEQSLLTAEVLRLLLRLVTDVNQHLVLVQSTRQGLFALALVR